jgi:transcription factor C subunit 6
MAPEASSNAEGSVAPPKKRGRPPKVKSDINESSTSRLDTSRRLKSYQKEAESSATLAVPMQEEEDELREDIGYATPMDVDQGTEGDNMFQGGNPGRRPTDIHPDTFILAEASIGRAARHRAPRQDSLAQEEDVLINIIAKKVEELLNAGAGASGAVGASKQARYRPNAEGTTSSCYMGPIQTQSLQSLAVDKSKPLAKLVDDSKKPGALFNVGGHVYSLDWLPTGDRELQYICVSASLEKNPHTTFGDRLVSEKRPARLQIWSIDEWYQAKLQKVLCFEQGWISTVRWLPMSTSFDKSTSILGLLSASMQDGSVGIYAVPRHPSGTTHIKVEPLVELNVKKGVPTAMEWFDADKVAVAYSDGWVSIWSLTLCLKATTINARPLIFSRVSTSPVTSLAWHTDGEQLFVSSFDGSIRCLQLSHPQSSTTVYHSREVLYSVAFSSAMQFLIMERAEADDVRSMEFSMGKSQTSTLYSHLGRVRAMSTSPHHSYVASGSVDGTLKVVEVAQFLTKSGKRGRRPPSVNIVMPVYRLDKNRGKEALRFIENLASQGTTQQAAHSSAAWDPEISLIALRWNPNKRKEAWIVSGMACGLMRVDVVDL